MDVKVFRDDRLVEYIFAIGFSVAAVILGGTLLMSAPGPSPPEDCFPLRRGRHKRSLNDPIQKNTKELIDWDDLLINAVADSTGGCSQRVLTVEDIASTFYFALRGDPNRHLVRKAFRSLSLLLVYDGNRSSYTQKMRIVLLSNFTSLFSSTICDSSHCAEACHTMQLLTALQSGPLALNYNEMLGAAGAIETLNDALHIHMPSVDDFFLDVSLVTRRYPNLDENIKRHIFEYLYWTDEHATIAQLCCRLIGRLFKFDVQREDYSGVLDGISLALAAHYKNANVALEALTTIATYKLIDISATVPSNSLYVSITNALKVHYGEDKIVTMCCRVLNDLMARKFKTSDLSLCEAIIACLLEFRSARIIRNGVFDELCETAVRMSDIDASVRDRFLELKIRQLIGSSATSLSRQRMGELFLQQMKFAPWGSL